MFMSNMRIQVAMTVCALCVFIANVVYADEFQLAQTVEDIPKKARPLLSNRMPNCLNRSLLKMAKKPLSYNSIF
jgi:hypothetical protein